LLLAAFAACPGKKPTPPPIQHCGNAICESSLGENSATCPQDCPETPPVCDLDGKCESGETIDNCADCKDKPPVCGDGKCSEGENQNNCTKDCKPINVCGDEPLDADCPPIPAPDFSKHRWLGIYTGPMSDEKFDLEAFFKELEWFNGVVVHITSPWNRVNNFAPIKFYGGKWHYNEWNEKWIDKLDFLLAAAGHYKREVMLKITDQYCDPKWYKYAPYPSKPHEFEKVCGKEGRDLYANWNRRDASDKRNFKLFQFQGEDTDIDSFRAVSDEGRYFMALPRLVAERVMLAMKNFPDLKVYIAANNEAFYYVVPGTTQFDHARSRNFDDRSLYLYQDAFKDAGWKNGKHGRWAINEEFLAGGPGGYLDEFWTDKTYRQYIAKKDYLYEFHGVGDVTEYRGYLDRLKMQPRHFLGSTDGEQENYEPKMHDGKMLRPYFERICGIAKAMPTGGYFDFKLSAKYEGAEKWHNTDMNKNLHWVDKMEKEMKKCTN
jgi:hypothetical protein